MAEVRGYAHPPSFNDLRGRCVREVPLMSQPSPVFHFEADPANSFDEYERHHIDQWSDVALADCAGSVLAVPLASELPAISFVLHAPLELLARLALLPYVTPRGRHMARVRIVSLAAGYASSGERLSSPVDTTVANVVDDADRLVRAVASGDLAEVDRVAPRFGACTSESAITSHLAGNVLPHLAAAGHGNIYLYLAETSSVRSLGSKLLWPVIRELTKSPLRAMTLTTPLPLTAPNASGAIASALANLPILGPAEVRGIAPMVERAEAEGVIAQFFNATGSTITSDAHAAARQLLRGAALMMLQGPADHIPYGWTHCLTLAQAPCELSVHVPDPCRAVAVAAEYVVAHWTCLGAETFDPTWQPERVDISPNAALGSHPDAAPSAIWYATEIELRDIEQELAAHASAAHDAHHVKYTLACLRAAAADPSSRRLFLAAAAKLYSWWVAHPDMDDPLADQSQAISSPPR